ncbi:MAG TPA: long-chain fatty acid--CoA ligase [Thermomicrobiales bacterium]|nr:long-chain fatty acid--CoA ligase [Thermomicrobiales bacterium]
MQGLMMDYQLTLDAVLRRAETFFGSKEIVTRLPDRSIHRYTYTDMVRRTRQLALALADLGVQPGDRVATLAWNHHQHLEAYFGIPIMGAVLHTLNLRLPAEDLVYIVNHANDRVLLVDQVLLPLVERIRSNSHIEHVIVIGADGAAPEGMLSYEQFIEGFDADTFVQPALDEEQAAAMCYSSGTTGRPKGAVYSHRALVLHSFASAMADTLGVRERDTVLPVVPMFHVNAWGLPFTSTMVGAKQVMPGPFLDPASLLELYQQERVTITAGVPTIWLGLLQMLDKDPTAWDLSSLRVLLVGGQAAPKSMIQRFRDRHGLEVVHAWGMTETSPLGSVAVLSSEMDNLSVAEQDVFRATQGRPAAFVEIRARGEEGLLPWDGASMGELEVRGPWVAAHYYNNPDAEESFTEDGWFRTGDIVTINSAGYIQIQDRAKDVVKSGGEWISSVALENALMGHPAVAEAAVFAVPDPRWLERPMAVVVLREGASVEPEALREYLSGEFPRWWLPDRVEFIEAIPRTSTGKFQKSVLREQYGGASAS